LELPHCQETVETLLAASRLETANNRERLLVQAANSGSYLHKTHLHAEIAHEWSVFFRSQGRIRDSDRVIQQFLHHHDPSIQVSWVSLGRLRISQAYNLAYKFDFDTARETLKWVFASDNLSEGEVHLLCDQLSCSGRILRGEGRFEEAKHCFDSCIAMIGLPKSKSLLIVSHLSDLHCEVDYAQCNNPSQIHLKEAKEMVLCEIGGARESYRHSRGLRWLLLSLLEVYIRQGQFHEAKTLIKELLDLYDKLSEPDINDKAGHVKALIARARISHLYEAEGYWMAALA
jgi:tetratricopeptide (TPR) repeat protein